MTRHYRPTTVAELGEWFDHDAVPRSERYFLAPEETDLGEYSALMDAADESANLPGSDGRRVVLVLETTGVSPDEAIPWRLVVALHMDVEAGARPDDELAWFATQEIETVLAGR